MLLMFKIMENFQYFSNKYNTRVECSRPRLSRSRTVGDAVGVDEHRVGFSKNVKKGCYRNTVRSRESRCLSAGLWVIETSYRCDHIIREQPVNPDVCTRSPKYWVSWRGGWLSDWSLLERIEIYYYFNLIVVASAWNVWLIFDHVYCIFLTLKVRGKTGKMDHLSLINCCL
jgi:hypothetical protein